MAKNTSILLGDYFDEFIKEQVKSGKFSSTSEVVRAALRLFEYEQTKKGEKSGFVQDFNPETFLDKIHQKYSATE